jgi:hypothetical protein
MSKIVILFLKGMMDALAPFSYLVITCLTRTKFGRKRKLFLNSSVVNADHNINITNWPKALK